MAKYTNFKNPLVKWEKIFSNEGNLMTNIFRFRTQSEDSRMAFYSFCQWLDNRQPDLTAHYTKIKNNPLYYHSQDCMYGRRFKRKDELQCIEEGKSWNKKKYWITVWWMPNAVLWHYDSFWPICQSSILDLRMETPLKNKTTPTLFDNVPLRNWIGWAFWKKKMSQPIKSQMLITSN